MRLRLSTLFLRAMCSLMGHPPRTWGNRELEDPFLETMNSRTLAGQPVQMMVGCVCGRKFVPFRAKPRGDQG